MAVPARAVVTRALINLVPIAVLATFVASLVVIIIEGYE